MGSTKHRSPKVAYKQHESETQRFIFTEMERIGKQWPTILYIYIHLCKVHVINDTNCDTATLL